MDKVKILLKKHAAGIVVCVLLILFVTQAAIYTLSSDDDHKLSITRGTIAMQSLEKKKEFTGDYYIKYELNQEIKDKCANKECFFGIKDSNGFVGPLGKCDLTKNACDLRIFSSEASNIENQEVSVEIRVYQSGSNLIEILKTSPASV